MGIKVTLAVIGMFIGASLIGLAWNDHLSQAWEVLSGSPITSQSNPPSNNPPSNTTNNPPGFPFPFPFHIPGFPAL